MIKDYLDKIKEEENRNAHFLHLTANESQMSETARMFLGSKLSERYYAGAGIEGIVDFGLFTQLGFNGIATLVADAENAAKEMLGADAIGGYIASLTKHNEPVPSDESAFFSTVNLAIPDGHHAYA